MSDTLNINAYSPQSGRFIAEDGTTENLADRLGQISAQLSTMGGTGSYNDMTDKPSINGVTLSGNKSLADLGIQGDAGLSVVDGKINITYEEE